MSTEIQVNQFSGRKQKSIRPLFVWTVIAFVLVVGAILAVQVMMKPPGRSLFTTDELPLLWSILMMMFLMVMASLAYYVHVRFVEERPVTELAWSGALSELGMGCAIGAGLFLDVIIVLWLLGYYRVIAVSSFVVVVFPFFDAVFSGVVEELVFRGIIFRIIEESFGSWFAIALSGIFFGFAHAAEPHATVLSSIAIALEAGILLAAAYMFTRRLWLAIGIHVAWNFSQGGIFGLAVAGTHEKGLLLSQLTGPRFLTGGSFGAETSIFAIVICLTAGLYLLWKAKMRQHFIPPFWKRKRNLELDPDRTKVMSNVKKL